MATVPVHFVYLTGIAGNIFPDERAQLHGSWDGAGRHSSAWHIVPMEPGVADDGCLCFRASCGFDASEIGRWFDWGVSLVRPSGAARWAIPTEVTDIASRACHRRFQLSASGQEERYYLTHCRRLGANKCVRPDGATAIRFSVWAPNATRVEVVMGQVWNRHDPTRAPAGRLPVDDIAGGYIADHGDGIHPTLGPFRMHQAGDGVWSTDADDPALRDFAAFDHRPYMFRITKDDGHTQAYRTDLYSRCQIGFGSHNPRGAAFDGRLSTLDGGVSCSVVVDPERVTKYFREEPPHVVPPPAPRCEWPEHFFVDAAEFWRDEFTDRRPPARLEDMIIYELHPGALGFDQEGPGTLADAIALLDQLAAAGVNAVELLPMSEFGGGAENWGYATSHHFAIEFGGGGRDQYKFFVKEAHRRGLAVLLDVVYNHFAHDAERAESRYDSDRPDRDIYYWYEGTPSQYASPDGGYLDNLSTAYAPRYHEEMVRRLFISSAVALAHEFHVDAFRVDQTTSIHSYNRRHADGLEVGAANVFGAKLLRELSRTLRLVKPEVLLIAEDHSQWHEVTLPSADGGMGFDARWQADFYHHLIGDTDKGMDVAKILFTAGRDQDVPLALDAFARVLERTSPQAVVYSESHDEAGNSKGPFLDPEWTPNDDKDKQYTSHRTIAVAVNGAPLFGDTRRYAEARCRWAWGMTALSAGVPMLLFGEEVGAEKRFKYNAVIRHKEDLATLRRTTGASLLAFYGAVNGLRLQHRALRSRNIAIAYVHNANRVLAFRRWDDGEEFLVVASLNNRPFDRGYVLAGAALPDAAWREVFNSDASRFGGDNVGNEGGTRASRGGEFACTLPMNGFVVFRRQDG